MLSFAKLSKCKISAAVFRCTDIVEHLVPIELGKMKVRRMNPLSNVERPARFSCLVCGDPVGKWNDERGPCRIEIAYPQIVNCSFINDKARPCKFACHSKCLSVHKKLSCDTLTTSFCCSDIIYQLRPSLVSTIFAQTPQSYRQKVASLQKMHVIRPSKDRRKRRFTNSNSVCSVCREEVPLTQTNHLLQHCTGIITV